MQTGRKPVPTRLRLARGSRRPINLNEPKPKACKPRCPSHLSDEAKAEWKRISVHLAREGLLTQLDRTALALYCQAYGRWVEAEAKAVEHGLVVKTTNGNAIPNPYLGVANKAAKQMLEILVEFGMTPSSRTRVTAVEEPDAGDPKARFFAQSA